MVISGDMNIDNRWVSVVEYSPVYLREGVPSWAAHLAWGCGFPMLEAKAILEFLVDKVYA